MENIQIGQNLQKLRKERGLTQQDVADRLNVSSKTVSKWECGNTLPDIFTLNALAQLYFVTVDEIINNKDKDDIPEKEVIESKDSINDLYKKGYMNKFHMWKSITYLVLGISVFLSLILTVILGFNVITCVFSILAGCGCFLIYFLSIIINKKEVEFDFNSEKMIKKENDKYRFITFLTSPFIMFLPFVFSSNFYIEVAYNTYLDVSEDVILYFILYIVIFLIGITIVNSMNNENSKLRQKIIKVKKNHILYYLGFALYFISFFVFPVGEITKNLSHKYYYFFNWNINFLYIYPFFFVLLLLLLITIYLHVKHKNLLVSYIAFLIIAIIQINFIAGSNYSELQKLFPFVLGCIMIIFLLYKPVLYFDKSVRHQNEIYNS